ncbi:conserved hypothetical protein [Ricinus communis]|uniref:Josephin-like protein n=1 Tax=Ricinus communis TaxID=3988 RepID=B9SHY6_RICCO|nr:conserved hypothetical protein [Ricinus communis]|eukprot:XP_002525605.1 josephin-like protein [Ricinus communis]
MSVTSKQVKKKPNISKKTSSGKQTCSSKRVAVNRVLTGCCGFKLPEIPQLSPLNFLKRLTCKMTKALRLWRRPSSRVSSSGRSKPFIAATDTHRSEAIEDCIEFINSSSASSLPRSNSVSANPS